VKSRFQNSFQVHNLQRYATEPLNRIKKEFLKEVKTMTKGERVLIVVGLCTLNQVDP
jgi:mannitol-1-phosphate/altronate dehydrogenase